MVVAYIHITLHGIHSLNSLTLGVLMCSILLDNSAQLIVNVLLDYRSSAYMWMAEEVTRSK